jgi:hypothetical protein
MLVEQCLLSVDPVLLESCDPPYFIDLFENSLLSSHQKPVFVQLNNETSRKLQASDMIVTKMGISKHLAIPTRSKKKKEEKKRETFENQKRNRFPFYFEYPWKRTCVSAHSSRKKRQNSSNLGVSWNTKRKV